MIMLSRLTTRCSQRRELRIVDAVTVVEMASAAAPGVVTISLPSPVAVDDRRRNRGHFLESWREEARA